jgi:hypothetical protein
MIESLAGLYMATKVHFSQINYPYLKRKDRVVAEEIYKNKVEQLEETEKYEKSLLPESGYMTVEEYEAKSRAKSRKDLESELTGGEVPKDSNMIYIPQKSFKLVKYNDPVGSPELSLPRKLNFDRQIHAQGIISGDKTMLVYPTVYYYAQADCTSCDLFLIKLDSKLTDSEKAIKTNIIQREDTPLISTDKDIQTKFMFRTLTPVDFSVDNKKLVVKEKIGYRHDGIWKTDLWVYNFETKEALKIPQIRDAIIEYWEQTGGVDFDENRWDIYPMGFDANNDDRIILCAYAYTGDVPKFLGTWSIDINGENSKLEDLTGSDVPVSIIGYRLAEDTVKDISEIEFEAKQAKEKEKIEEKKKKEADKFEKKVKELEYERKIRQMDMDTYLKIKQRQEYLKKLNKNKTQESGLTGAN